MAIIIKETSGYKNSYKKIKNNYEIINKLNKIITYLESLPNSINMEQDMVIKMYGYEALRDDLSGYYRFSLDKNASFGKHRLIFSKIDDKHIQFEYISKNHYEDFKRYLRS